MLAIAVSFDDDLGLRLKVEFVWWRRLKDGGGAPLVFDLIGMEHLNAILFHKSWYSKDAVT